MEPKKSLGQNFLRDTAIVSHILSAISSKKDEIIVEVGPGEGVLTEYLVKSGARVLAVELDDRLAIELKKKFSAYTNVTVVHNNILRTFVAKELVQAEWAKDIETIPFRVVGNLPYYITSAIIRMFLEMRPKPKELFFMVQKEVAERIVAKPGSMSVLSVAVQYYADPEILFSVSSKAFFPVPKVESAFIKIVLKNNTDSELSRKLFFRIVKAGFSSRRKMLANTISNSLHVSKEQVISVLKSLKISQTARAQELSVDDWRALARSFPINM